MPPTLALVMQSSHSLHVHSTYIQRTQTPDQTRVFSYRSGKCPSGDTLHTVVKGDTVSALAFTSGISTMDLATLNTLTNPNLILVGQNLCLPTARSSKTSSSTPPPSTLSFNTGATSQANPYPYGQCAWWANQRFSQIHSYFVPWTSNADAWQWTARAYDYGWHVASTPSVGSIIDLQPLVQGAYSLGHVAYVEQVLSNGNVIASTLNWGPNPGIVVNVEFSPGPGVTFLSR